MDELRSIFEYDNYRAFLRDFYLNAKTKGRKYSFKYFSNLLGFSSTSFFKHVIDGERNLSLDSVERFIAILKFNKDEAAYFRNLVALNQAKSSEERARHSQEIMGLRAYRRIHPLKEIQYNYYTHWYYVVVRELVNLPHFREDPEWIAANTLPAITARQAQEALSELQKLGLLERDSAGKLAPSATIVSTPDEVTSASIAQFHKEFMKKAAESIDLVPRENRDISSVTFRVSGETARRIKEKIQKFRRELAEEASRDSSPDAIYQLNLQLFPVTQIAATKNRGGQGQ